MQTVLTKYWLVVHLGLVWFASWFGLFQPRGPAFLPLLWTTLLAAEAFVLLPSVRRGETLSDARQRAGRDLLHDPLLYLGLSAVALLVLQWLNSGCKLVYLSEADIWQFSLPPVAWLPFSVEPAAALRLLLATLACVAGCLLLRQGVGKAGKRLLLQAACAASGLLASCLVWRSGAGDAPFSEWARAPLACNPGSFFGFWLIVSMGAFADAVVRRQSGVGLLLVLGFAGNLAGMLVFAGALSAAAYLLATLLMVAYWLVFLGSNASKALQLKVFLFTVSVAAVAVLAVGYLFPGNPVAEKARSLGDWQSFWSGLSAAHEVRAEAALKIWKEHPWIGVGADGFSHYVGAVVQGQDWSVIKREPGFVGNEWLQALCEFGALGVGLLASFVVALLVPICYRLRLAAQTGGGEFESRLPLLRLSPLVLSGALAALLAFAESWIANPFKSSALQASWVLVMTAMPAFLPAKPGPAK